VAVELGTGDGRAVLATAAGQPDTLAIGVDANAAAMARSSRRAWRRDALPNALFAVAAAERPPEALHGLAGSLTVNFPWDRSCGACWERTTRCSPAWRG
jgi:16S rRNA (adenine(1408)-N(1))-methyltransferase